MAEDAAPKRVARIAEGGVVVHPVVRGGAQGVVVVARAADGGAPSPVLGPLSIAGQSVPGSAGAGSPRMLREKTASSASF